MLLLRAAAADLPPPTANGSSHLAPMHGAFPFPRDLFEQFVSENDGYFPVKLQALRDGTCVHAHVPVYQVCVHTL